eukprot:gnl/MRDRNA2_/MRDRNA2_29364_c0_seq1.p1 gnl/MRDRNA2_/MRDRNA2_29364_c0~~gnl/MRDRNA2_/MRDRNA2_29364_c0_seq1.p1  ORF type:complete len:539 (+),score=90.81 gnl/MRDRNA2_/MRDRNA2_29364_c0_seq1:168-1619(+)
MVPAARKTTETVVPAASATPSASAAPLSSDVLGGYLPTVVSAPLSVSEVVLAASALSSDSAALSAPDVVPAAISTLTDVKMSSVKGTMVGPGKAHFPVMSEDEVAAISVPVTASSEQLHATLAEHGVCLVTGVLKKEECESLEQLWKKDLLDLIERKAGRGSGAMEVDACQILHKKGLHHWPSKWNDSVGRKGTASQRAMPHGSFAWTARLHPEIRNVFSAVYSVPSTELAVGLDCVFWSGADAPAAESNDEWLHCDQNHRTGLTHLCYQGVLYVWGSGEECASTTVVWPGSHKKVYDRLMDDRFAFTHGRKSFGQSIRLSNLQDESLRAELTEMAVAGSRRVPCPAGSLLLWDSRTIHQGWAGGPRLAMPVCWEPKARRDGDALNRKVFMCAAGVPSSHSSCEGRVHGMAPKRCPESSRGGPWGPAMKAQLVPHGIAEKQVKMWEGLQELLWGGSGDPRKNVHSVDATQLVHLLKPEVLHSL